MADVAASKWWSTSPFFPSVFLASYWIYFEKKYGNTPISFYVMLLKHRYFPRKKVKSLSRRRSETSRECFQLFYGMSHLSWKFQVCICFSVMLLKSSLLILLRMILVNTSEKDTRVSEIKIYVWNCIFTFEVCFWVISSSCKIWFLLHWYFVFKQNIWTFYHIFRDVLAKLQRMKVIFTFSCYIS